MARIFVVANQKGGVGKTSIAVNLCASLAHYGRRVLLVDLDPQGNATTGSGVDKSRLRARRSTACCSASTPLAEARRALRGRLRHRALEPRARRRGGRADRDRDVANTACARRSRRWPGNYDFVVIDCPPALNMLTVNGFTAADAVIIPMQCEYYALEGLSDLVGTLRKVKQNLNPRIEIEALVRTMYDPRSTLTIQVSDELKRHYGDKVFDTVIPRNIRIAEAPSFGKPVLLHDPGLQGRASRTCVRARAAGPQRHQGGARPPDHDQAQGTGPRTRCAAGRQRQGARARKTSSRSSPVAALRPGKYQPRTRMDEASLAELADSIRVARRDPADRGAPGGRRAVRDPRRRAPLARGAHGGPRARSRR